jgi:hypothetical protein
VGDVIDFHLGASKSSIHVQQYPLDTRSIVNAALSQRSDRGDEVTASGDRGHEFIKATNLRVPSMVRGVLSASEQIQWLEEQRFAFVHNTYQVTSTNAAEEEGEATATRTQAVMTASYPLASEDSILVDILDSTVEATSEYLSILATDLQAQSRLTTEETSMLTSVQTLMLADATCDANFLLAVVVVDGYLQDFLQKRGKELFNKVNKEHPSVQQYRAYFCGSDNIVYYSTWLLPGQSVNIPVKYNLFWPRERHRLSLQTVNTNNDKKLINVDGVTMDNKLAILVVATSAEETENLRHTADKDGNNKGNNPTVRNNKRYNTKNHMEATSWQRYNLASRLFRAVEDAHVLMVVGFAWVAIAIFYYILQIRRRKRVFSWRALSIVDILFLVAVLISLLVIYVMAFL